MKFGIGQSVPRSEDPRLVTGKGEYTADINRPNQLYLRVLRSPYAHGHISELDITDAPGMQVSPNLQRHEALNFCKTMQKQALRACIFSRAFEKAPLLHETWIFFQTRSRCKEPYKRPF